MPVLYLLLAIGYWLSAGCGRAADWPQYRGPNHDGVSIEKIRTDWAQQPPRLIWKTSLQPGLSSFSIGGGKAFTQVRRRVGSEEKEFCIALDANTGAELWATPVGVAFYPNGGVGVDDGPRSTPSLDGGRVYVLSSYLQIYCLDAATGKEIWSRDLAAELGATVIEWQNAASPLIRGDLIFLNCNVPNQRLMALQKEDGKTAWQAHNDPMTQSTPVAATIAGVPQIIFFTQSGLVSVVPESGQVLWRYPFPYSLSTAASPVVAGDTVYCSAAYGIGAGLARIKAAASSFSAEQVWRAPGGHMNHWATPVYFEGHFYGVYGHSLLTLRCIEAATGQEKWREGGVGYGSILLAGETLLVVTETGTLVLVKPDPAAYQEIARHPAVTGKSWNVPALSNGRVYVRSTTEAAAYEIAPPSAPKPRLRLVTGLSDTPDTLRFLIITEDGSPLDSERAGDIDVLVTTEISDPARWTRLKQIPSLRNGHLQLEFPRSTLTLHQFFKTQEPP